MATMSMGLGPSGRLEVGVCPNTTGEIFPLSCLPVSLAKDIMIAQYIVVGTLAVSPSVFTFD